MKKSRKTVKEKIKSQYKPSLKNKIAVKKQRIGVREIARKIRPLNDTEKSMLSRVLRKLETALLYNEGLNRIDGGFAKANMTDSDKDTIDIMATWGAKNDKVDYSYDRKWVLDRKTMEPIKDDNMEKGGEVDGKYQVNDHGDKPTDYKILCRIIRTGGKDVQVCYHERNDHKENGVEVYSGKNYIVGSNDVSYSKKYDEVSEVPVKYKAVVDELIEAHHDKWGCGCSAGKHGTTFNAKGEKVNVYIPSKEEEEKESSRDSMEKGGKIKVGDKITVVNNDMFEGEEPEVNSEVIEVISPQKAIVKLGSDPTIHSEVEWMDGRWEITRNVNMEKGGKINKGQVNYFIEKFRSKMDGFPYQASAYWVDGITELNDDEKRLVWKGIQGHVDKSMHDKNEDLPSWTKGNSMEAGGKTGMMASNENKKTWIVNIAMPSEKGTILRKEEFVLGRMSDEEDVRQAITRKQHGSNGQFLGNGKVLSIVEKRSSGGSMEAGGNVAIKENPLLDRINSMEGSADDKLNYLKEYQNKYKLSGGAEKNVEKIRAWLVRIRENERKKEKELKKYTPIPVYKGSKDDLGSPTDETQMDKWIAENIDNVPVKDVFEGFKFVTDNMKAKHLKGLYFEYNKLGSWGMDWSKMEAGGLTSIVDNSGVKKIHKLGLTDSSQFGDKYRDWLTKVNRLNNNGEYVGYQLSTHRDTITVIGKKGTIEFEIEDYDNFPKGAKAMRAAVVHYEKGGKTGHNYEIKLIENKSLPRMEWKGVVSEKMYNELEGLKNQGGFLRYEIDLYDDKSNEKIDRKMLKGLDSFMNHVGIKYSSIDSMEKGGAIDDVSTPEEFKEWAAERKLELVDELNGFHVGDKVRFTNPQGVVFEPRTIIGIGKDDSFYNRRFYLNNDSYWFPHKIEEIEHYKSSMSKGGNINTLRSLIKKEIENQKNEEYDNTDESEQNQLEIINMAERDFGYDYEQDDDAFHYFLKATPQEIWQYWLDVILPKLEKGYVPNKGSNRELKDQKTNFHKEIQPFYDAAKMAGVGLLQYHNANAFTFYNKPDGAHVTVKHDYDSNKTMVEKNYGDVNTTKNVPMTLAAFIEYIGNNRKSKGGRTKIRFSDFESVKPYYEVAKKAEAKGLIKKLSEIDPPDEDGIIGEMFSFRHVKDKCDVTIFYDPGYQGITMSQDYNDGNPPEDDDISLEGFREYVNDNKKWEGGSMAKGGKITESDIKPGRKFKFKDGTVFIVDEVKPDKDFGTAVRTSLESGEKGNYRDSIEEVVAFFNEEGAKKIG